MQDRLAASKRMPKSARHLMEITPRLKKPTCPAVPKEHHQLTPANLGGAETFSLPARVAAEANRWPASSRTGKALG